MIPRGCRCKGLSGLRWRLGALLFADLGRTRPPALFFPLGKLNARNSPDNLCRGRACTQRPLVAMVRRGLSLPIRLYSVTVRFDKRLHIPVILLNDDPNNPRQTFVHARGLFLFKAFVEHFYQSLRVMGACDHAEILESLPAAGAKASRRPLSDFIVTGSRRGMTQKLFRFGHFGIPFL